MTKKELEGQGTLGCSLFSWIIILNVSGWLTQGSNASQSKYDGVPQSFTLLGIALPFSCMWNQFWHQQRARPLRMPRCRWNVPCARLSCAELPHTVRPWNSALGYHEHCMQIGQQRDKYACCTCLLRHTLHCPIRLELAFLLLFLFSRSTLSDSLWPHGLHHARFLCPSLLPRVCPNSCPLSWWCHPIN